MIRVVCCLIGILLCSCSSTSNLSRSDSNDPWASMPSEPGKCYARCLLADQLLNKEIEIIEFIGNRSSEYNNVEEVELVIVPETPTSAAEVKKYLTVKDTSKTENFRIVKIQTKELVKGGFTGWKEVICNSDVTPEFYTKINRALFREGYNVDPKSSIMSDRSKKALVQYQRDNDMPIGQIDMDTINALEVKY